MSLLPLTLAAALLLAIPLFMHARKRLLRYSRRRFLTRTLGGGSLHDDAEERSRMDVEAVTTQFQSISEEIDLKQKELTNFALFIKQERDYIERMCLRLMEIAELQSPDAMREEITRQVGELRENICFNKEKEQFYTEVEKIHTSFVSRLLMRCPNLTEGEKRLAILLRLGFSSKEIAALTNVETKSVEINRYRFRKKLRLDRNVNIVKFLQLL